ETETNFQLGAYIYQDEKIWIIRNEDVITVLCPDEYWERYKKKAYSSLDEAMSYYVLYLFNPQIYAVKLFEEILIDGETVREAYIEPVSTFSWRLKKILNQDLNRANG